MKLKLNKAKLDQAARKEIDKHLGSLDRFTVISNEDIAFIAKQLASGKKVTKDMVLKQLAKKNDKLEVALEVGDVAKAEKVIAQNAQTSVEKSSTASHVVSDEYAAQEMEYQNPRSQQVEKETELVENVAAAAVITQSAEIVPQRVEAAVDRYQAGVKDGTFKQAPFAYDVAAESAKLKAAIESGELKLDLNAYKKQRDAATEKKMQEDAADFAKNRSMMNFVKPDMNSFTFKRSVGFNAA